MTNSGQAIAPGRGQATRDKITVAAAELVAELGWGAVTTRAVAARAGVNQALIHYHFGSMEALLRGAVVAALDSELSKAAHPFEVGTLADGLRGAVDAVARFDPGSPSTILLAEALVRAMRDPNLAEVMIGSLQGFRDLVAEHVRAAAAAGEVPSDLPPEATGTLVTAALDGLLFHRIVDPTTDVAGVRDVLLRLVGASAAPVQGGPS
jgi:AcrR family transcriptional regulator